VKLEEAKIERLFFKAGARLLEGPSSFPHQSAILQPIVPPQATTFLKTDHLCKPKIPPKIKIKDRVDE